MVFVVIKYREKIHSHETIANSSVYGKLADDVCSA